MGQKMILLCNTTPAETKRADWLAGWIHDAGLAEMEDGYSPARILAFCAIRVPARCWQQVTGSNSVSHLLVRSLSTRRHYPGGNCPLVHLTRFE
jgi:hypothetical protein